MTIQFKCDSCGKALKVDDSKAGKRVKCPGCQEVITIPQPLEAEEEEEKDEFDFGSSQDEDDNDDDDQGEALPRKRSKPKSKSKSKRPSRQSAGEVAGLGKRFLGAFVDNLAFLLAFAPGYIMIIVGAVNQRGGQPDPGPALIGLGIIFISMIILLGVQIYLLATRSQSIGKLLLGTQVIDYETDEPAGFVKTFLMRGVVNGMICGIPIIGLIYSLVDILFIFGEEHRCIHDQLAGTYVAEIS